MHKDILRRLLAGFYFLLFPALLLALSRYSYRARELLVCWLFFCSLFALLALLFLGVVLAWHAGQLLIVLSRVPNTVTPNLVQWLAQLLQESISAPRIVDAGALKPQTGSAVAVSALDPSSCLLVEVLPPIELRVQK
jgi:hypothetical protein